ncbi:MAG: acyltransferase [Bacteroidia bacterium]|nr:acyltransferase [Bacteroidia bacterium]
MRTIRLLQMIIRRYFLFIIPNLSKFFHGKIQVSNKYPTVNQLTKVTGVGYVVFGTNISFGYKLGGFHRNGMIELQARYKNAKIVFGNNIATNNNVCISAANYIEIGDNTLIGQNVTIMDFEAHCIEPDKRRQLGVIGKVIIGENVWIGNNVTILKNSEIGKNTIIATGAVVAGLFPANVIIGGVPAKVIKNL